MAHVTDPADKAGSVQEREAHGDCSSETDPASPSSSAVHIVAALYLELEGPERQAAAVTWGLLVKNPSCERSIPMGSASQAGHAPSTNAASA